MLEPYMIGMAGTHSIVGRVPVSGSFVAELATGRRPRRGRETHGENRGGRDDFHCGFHWS